jgi:hypothetical protein
MEAEQEEKKLKKLQSLRAAKKVHRKRVGNNMLETTQQDYLACKILWQSLAVWPWRTSDGA